MTQSYKYADLPRGRMRYCDFGDMSRPVMLVTSGWATIPKLRRLYDDNLGKSFRVVLHEHLGLGESAAPAGEITIEAMADDLAALCAHLGLRSVHLDGFGGMGGLVGLSFLTRHAHLVRAAHLGSPCLSLGPFERSLFEHWKRLYEIDIYAWAQDVTLWVYAPETFANKPDLVRQAVEVRATDGAFKDAAMFGQFVDAYIAFEADIAAVSQIDRPVLVTTGGDEDLFSGPRTTRPVYDLIPGARFKSFEGTSHNYFTEQKAAWSTLVANFFETQHVEEKS